MSDYPKEQVYELMNQNMALMRERDAYRKALEDIAGPISAPTVLEKLALVQYMAKRALAQQDKPRCGPCDMMGSPCALHEVRSSDDCPNRGSKGPHFEAAAFPGECFYCGRKMEASKSNQGEQWTHNCPKMPGVFSGFISAGSACLYCGRKQHDGEDSKP